MAWNTTYVTNMGQGPINGYYVTRESQTTRNIYWSRASVCLSVSVSIRRRMPTLLHGPGCNLEEW